MSYQKELKYIYLKPDNCTANTKKKIMLSNTVFALELDLLLEDFIEVLK